MGGVHCLELRVEDARRCSGGGTMQGRRAQADDAATLPWLREVRVGIDSRSDGEISALYAEVGSMRREAGQEAGTRRRRLEQCTSSGCGGRVQAKPPYDIVEQKS